MIAGLIKLNKFWLGDCHADVYLGRILHRATSIFYSILVQFWRNSVNKKDSTTQAIINIATAEQVRDFRIHLQFDDGTEQAIDFKPFLTNTLHPDIRAWLDPDRFATFRLEYGELVWGDYDLCFPVIDLYRNQIERNASLEAVA